MRGAAAPQFHIINRERHLAQTLRLRGEIDTLSLSFACCDVLRIHSKVKPSWRLIAWLLDGTKLVSRWYEAAVGAGGCYS